MTNSLGFVRDQRRVTFSIEAVAENGDTSITPRTRWSSPMPWRSVPLVLLSLAEVVHIQTTLKTTHEHPHTHAQRFAWQTNLYLNVITTYFALEVAFPALRLALSHFHSVFVSVGLLVDYFVIWGVAAIVTLPIELSHHAGDHEISRPNMIVLYAALGVAFALKTWYLWDASRALTFSGEGKPTS